jgi:hypothetical protein
VGGIYVHSEMEMLREHADLNNSHFADESAAELGGEQTPQLGHLALLGQHLGARVAHAVPDQVHGVGREHAEVDVRGVEALVDELRQPVAQHPQVLTLVHAHVVREHQLLIIAVHHALELGPEICRKK